MLTLDRVREEILGLMKSCETNPERARSGIQEIFYMLMCADQPFYLIYTRDAPLLSPAASDGKNLYLHLFSHKEVAERQLNRTETVYKEHSLLDILQIGRWAFLGGAYGFVLNEGDRWMRISIPEVLSLFFTRIYGDSGLCSQDCTEAIFLINEIRRNGSYRYGMKLNESGEWTGEVQPGLLPPLTIPALFHIPTNNLQVERGGVPCVYSRENLRKALILCGYEPNVVTPLSGAYEDEPTALPPFVDENWRVEEPEGLALTFIPIPTKEPEKKQSSDEEPQAEAIPAAIEVFNPPEGKENALSFIRRKLRRKQARIEPVQEPVVVVPEPEKPEPEPTLEPIRKPDTKPAEKIRSDIAKKDALPQDPFDNKSEPISRETMDTGEGRGKGRKKLWIAASVVFAIVLITGSFFVIGHLQYKENLKSFRTYIAAQDYAKAYILYQNTKFGSDADGYLMDEVDGLVLRYANNEISADELSASLKVLSNFSSLSQELEIAKLTASKLEESKNAYVVGKESADIYERLNAWRQVVPLDAVNYTAVLQSVEDNESRYVDILRADIEYYRTRILEFAEDRVNVLSYWYPENEYVPALIKEFSSTQSMPLSYYPISITDIRIRQESNSYWTLYVYWSNMSVKTINSICFSVAALGEDGEIVTCEDAQGEWTIFDAMDNNRYEPEEEPSFDKYYWNGAFYGPSVRSARLTAVNIDYRDGTSVSYTSNIDLDRITAF